MAEPKALQRILDELPSRDDVPVDVREALAELAHVLAGEAAARRASDDGLVADVTERRETEAALRASEERYRRIVTTSLEGIWELDADLVTTYVNQRMAEMLGYTQEEMIGRPPGDFISDEDRAAHLEEMERRRAGQATAYELRFRRRDGSTLWTLASGVPVEAPAGSFAGAFAMFTDITERKRTEEALRKEGAFSSLVIAKAAEGLCVCHAISEHPFVAFTVWNDRMTEITGHTMAEINRLGWYQTMYPEPESQRRAVERMARMRLGDDIAAEEWTVTRADGEQRILSICTAAFAAGDGGTHVLAVMNDVTERKRADDKLRASEQLFRALIEHSQDAVTMIRADGTIVFDSPSISHVLGYAPTERVGTSVFAYVHPEEREAMTRGFTLFAQQSGAIAISRVRFLHKDGTYRWIEGVRTNLLDDPVVRAVVVNYRDVTERWEADKALRQSEERLSRLIDSASDSICLLDSELRFVEVNRRGLAIAGKAREDVIGRSIVEIVPDVVESGSYARHKEVLRTGEPFVVDNHIPHPVFGDMHFELKSFKVGDGLGVIATDITERKRAEEERRRLEAQVQHSQKLESLGVLAGGIAHDFNNLLVGVLGNASLAAMNLPADSPARAQLKNVETAARRASELCNQLLAYSGRGTFVVELVDLGQLIEELVNLMRVSIAKKVDLRLDLVGGPLTVNGDATQLRQVILNLVVNASEAIGDREGVITLTTGPLDVDRATLADAVHGGGLPEGRYAFVGIQDTGMGMDADTRARLFDPFFTTKMTGRGLGLAAVLGIVRAHHGAIAVTSAPGQGTTFRVLLPLAETAEIAATRPLPASASEHWSGEGVVLVVDDEPAVLEIAQCILEPLGFTPLTASDGRAGVEVFNAHADEIRAVFLDLTMPHLSGEEVLGQIRGRRPDVPVVLMSGYSEHGIADPITRERIAGFLHKPFDVAAFTEALRRAVERPEALARD